MACGDEISALSMSLGASVVIEVTREGWTCDCGESDSADTYLEAVVKLYHHRLTDHGSPS